MTQTQIKQQTNEQTQLEKLTHEEFTTFLAYGFHTDTLVYENWDVFTLGNHTYSERVA